MFRKQFTLLLLAAALVSPALAQQQKCCKGNDVVTFSPQKGQWQVNITLGSNDFYDGNQLYHLLPTYTMTDGEIGLPNGSGIESGNLMKFLNIQQNNDNSLINMAGIDAKYFVSDCWAVNFGASLIQNLTPSKNYVEGDYQTVPDMVIPAQKYINAQMANRWYVHAGFDRYFNSERFARIHPYLGASVGFQMARIDITEPYTGEVYDDDIDNDDIDELDHLASGGIAPGTDKHVYIAAGKAGQMFGIKASAVAGIEYSLAKGFIVGFEFKPLSYRYDVIQICPRGFDTYNATNHHIRVCDMPSLKVGFRF